MAERKPVAVHTVFNMSGVTYVEGYDDPGANVVIVCSNQKAFRIHDYFLKAERLVRSATSLHWKGFANELTIAMAFSTNSVFFRQMFEDSIQSGAIVLEEPSWDLHFIFDRITKRPLDQDDLHLDDGISTGHKLARFVVIGTVCRKYMFDTVCTSVHRLIAQFAHECPPQALAFALSCDPPDASMARSALASFNDLMTGDSLPPYFLAGSHTCCFGHHHGCYYMPTASNLSWSFVNEVLGLKGYYAYSRALELGQRDFTTWNWKQVAEAFLQEMNMSTPSIVL